MKKSFIGIVFILLIVSSVIVFADKDTEVIIKQETNEIKKHIDEKANSLTPEMEKYGNFLMTEGVRNFKTLLLFFALYILAIELLVQGLLGLYRIRKEREINDLIYSKLNKLEDKMNRYLPDEDDKQ